MFLTSYFLFLINGNQNVKLSMEAHIFNLSNQEVEAGVPGLHNESQVNLGYRANPVSKQKHQQKV